MKNKVKEKCIRPLHALDFSLRDSTSISAFASQTTSWTMFLNAVVAITYFAMVAHAKCECGFKDEAGRVWMDGMVIPFDKVADLNNSPDLWMNDYVHNIGHGTHMYDMDPANTYKDGSELVLKVTAPTAGANTVKSAQVSSRRKDLFYGTYRSEIKMPQHVGSSCVGFFQYHNDTEEIDMEWITQKPDMLYLSTKATTPDGTVGISYKNHYYYSADGLGLYSYRDYRFDWMPNQVDFFVDNKLVYSESTNVQKVSGRWMLMNWANGDQQWSGMPVTDSLARVKNVRSFFNSSHPTIVDYYNKACSASSGNADAVCDIASVPSTELYGYEENVVRKFNAGKKSSGGSVVKPAPTQPVTSSASDCVGTIGVIITLVIVTMLMFW